MALSMSDEVRVALREETSSLHVSPTLLDDVRYGGRRRAARRRVTRYGTFAAAAVAVAIGGGIAFANTGGAVSSPAGQPSGYSGTVPNGGTPGSDTAPPSPPAKGQPVARLYIPRMGQQWPVVEGTDPDDTKSGPGHFPDSALPGQVGNFAVVGHRVAAIFWDLDQIKVGDPIIVESSGTWYVYSTTKTHVVAADQTDVVAPVPEEPGAKPTRAALTLVTGHPKVTCYERLVVHAELVRHQPTGGTPPRELGDLRAETAQPGSTGRPLGSN